MAGKGKGEQMTVVAGIPRGQLPARLCHCSPGSLWAGRVPSLCLSLLARAEVTRDGVTARPPTASVTGARSFECIRAHVFL